MKICVIGTGYVGLTTGACLAYIGHDVICTDCDKEKIAGLRQGRLPIYEEHLPDVLAAGVQSRRLQFTSEIAAAIEAAEVIFVCVGTPPDRDGKANMAAVEQVTRQIAEVARGHKWVVGKSTVPVRTAERIEKTLRTYAHGRFTFGVISNPEFLREGTGIYDFFHPDRIIIGRDHAGAEACMRALYAPVLEGRFDCPAHGRPAQACGWRAPVWLATSTASAELIKHAANSFLSLKITYANAISDLCELAGANVEEVLRGIGLDPRIGPQFLRPGIGFGGFCFPKDLSAFHEIAAELGYDFRLLAEVQAMNDARPRQFIAELRDALWVLDGKRVGVLGLAFKPGTDDIRLSPACVIVRELLRVGMRIRVYDPQAMERARRELLPPEGSAALEYCESGEAVAEQAEALLILTEWPQFLALDWAAMAARMTRLLVLDGRNLFPLGQLEAFGYEYISIGRPTNLAAVTLQPEVALPAGS